MAQINNSNYATFEEGVTNFLKTSHCFQHFSAPDGRIDTGKFLKFLKSARDEEVLDMYQDSPDSEETEIIGEFRYHNSLDRKFIRNRLIATLTFDVNPPEPPSNEASTKTLAFDPPVKESVAVRAAEEYLSRRVNQRYWDALHPYIYCGRVYEFNPKKNLMRGAFLKGYDYLVGIDYNKSKQKAVLRTRPYDPYKSLVDTVSTLNRIRCENTLTRE